MNLLNPKQQQTSNNKQKSSLANCNQRESSKEQLIQTDSTNYDLPFRSKFNNEII